MQNKPTEMMDALQGVYSRGGTPEAEQVVVAARAAELAVLPGPIKQAERDRSGYSAAIRARLGEVASPVSA